MGKCEKINKRWGEKYNQKSLPNWFPNMFDMQSVCEDCEKLNVSNQASEKQSRNLSVKVTGEQ